MLLVAHFFTRGWMFDSGDLAAHGDNMRLGLRTANELSSHKLGGASQERTTEPFIWGSHHG
ncbi:hypothetical protein BJX65DRAFT_263749 [Aspergillus insuetus]